LKLLADSLISLRAYGQALELLLGHFSDGHDEVVEEGILICLLMLGRYQELVQRSEHAARQSPPRGYALRAYLQACHHSGGLEEAIHLAEEHLQSATFPRELFGVLSLIYFDAGQSVEARACARAMGDTQSLEASIVLASLSLLDGAVDEARGVVASAVELWSDQPRLYSVLGQIKLVEGNFVGAEGDLRRAVLGMPAHIGSWHALAWSQILGGRLDDARASFDRALALDPNFSETHGGIAVVAALSGDRVTASAEATKARRLDAGSFAVQYAELVLSKRHTDPSIMRRAIKRAMSQIRRPQPS
jgi:tetratricopeptide (TPR) repeat protein